MVRPSAEGTKSAVLRRSPHLDLWHAGRPRVSITPLVAKPRGHSIQKIGGDHGTSFGIAQFHGPEDDWAITEETGALILILRFSSESKTVERGIG